MLKSNLLDNRSRRAIVALVVETSKDKHGLTDSPYTKQEATMASMRLPPTNDPVGIMPLSDAPIYEVVESEHRTGTADIGCPKVGTRGTIVELLQDYADTIYILHPMKVLTGGGKIHTVLFRSR